MTACDLGSCGLLEQAITAEGGILSGCCMHDGWSAVKGGHGVTRSVSGRRLDSRLRDCLPLTAAVWHDCHGWQKGGMCSSSMLESGKARCQPSGPKSLVAPINTAGFDNCAGWVYSAGTYTAARTSIAGLTWTSSDDGPSVGTAQVQRKITPGHGQLHSTSASVTQKSHAKAIEDRRSPTPSGLPVGRGPVGEGTRRGDGSESDTRLSLEAQAMPDGRGTR